MIYDDFGYFDNGFFTPAFGDFAESNGFDSFEIELDHNFNPDGYLSQPEEEMAKTQKAEGDFDEDIDMPPLKINLAFGQQDRFAYTMAYAPKSKYITSELFSLENGVFESALQTISDGGHAEVGKDAIEDLKIFHKTQQAFVVGIANTESSAEDFFCFFVRSLKAILANYHCDLANINHVRSLPFPSFIVDQASSLCKLLQYDADRLIFLKQGLEHLCLFIRATKYSHQFNVPTWIDEILIAPMKENTWLLKNFLSRGKNNSLNCDEQQRDVNIRETQANILIQTLIEECDGILSSQDVSSIMKGLRAYPYCKDVVRIEYVLFCRAQKTSKYSSVPPIEGYEIYPIQLHAAKYFLTYFSRNLDSHSWGHKDKDSKTISKQMSTDTLRGIFRASDPFYAATKIEGLKLKYTEGKICHLLDAIVRADDVKNFILQHDHYVPCKGRCKQVRPDFKKEMTIADLCVPETWEILSDSEQQEAMEAFAFILEEFKTPAYVKSLKNAIRPAHSYGSPPRIWEMDMTEMPVHDCFFPLLKKAFTNTVSSTSKLYVMDRLFKILNIFCSNIDAYFINHAQCYVEEKPLYTLLAKSLPERNVITNFKYLQSTQIIIDFLHGIKTMELTKFVGALKSGKEIDLSFEAREGIHVNKNLIKDTVTLQSVLLKSDKYGLREIVPVDASNKTLSTIEAYPDISLFVKHGDISLFVKFIAEQWQKGK
jgi:hypothetical protein